MEKAILGKKLGMTQIFTPEGEVVPVTVIEAGPCYVVQKKTAAIDGYEAIQVGFGKIKEKHVTKPQAGHFAKAKTAPTKYLREFRLLMQCYEAVRKLKLTFRRNDWVDFRQNEG